MWDPLILVHSIKNKKKKLNGFQDLKKLTVRSWDGIGCGLH